jgi:hypothetical protein
VSTSADYVGRSIDLLIFDDLTPNGEALLTQALVQDGGSGKVITGVQKLVQRFLLELLTDYESMPYDQDRGCLFLYEAKAGLWQTQLDVMGSFARAATRIARNLRAEEVATDPADERFGSVTLNSVSLSAGTAKVYFELQSLAGTSRVVIFPIAVGL